MSKQKIDLIKQELDKKEEIRSKKEYFNKYYPKQLAKKLFKEWKETKK
ncbi:hypothetical protein IJI31_01045 [bacterium]|nr:hypothetical protein [bacterium]